MPECETRFPPNGLARPEAVRQVSMRPRPVSIKSRARANYPPSCSLAAESSFVPLAAAAK